MKRLKYKCPFNGKNYPAILATIGFYLGPLIGVTMMLDEKITILISFGLPILILAICFWNEQRLSEAEQTMVEYAEAPLWVQVTPEIQQEITKRKGEFDQPLSKIFIICGAVGCVVLFGSMFFSGHRANPVDVVPAAVSVAAGAMVVLMLLRIRSKQWNHMDETAVYTKIPIDHMFDVTHHSKHSTWTTSYLVFYQPDGRYVLRVRDKIGGFANMVTIVKYNNMLTWYLSEERDPENWDASSAL